ncbi:putative inorganic phosphate cotransporter isoform X2 [Galleria mellonella]|uniref:Inorganic phosphate cotransporter isoform X2 n=1 Tax=Galleria mellonella TaxID=7137 RepID=A0ABM3M860_GALME|nr:putative inorganic phosphate cotransporter isoform X2 [Galleria mellonella]
MIGIEEQFVDIQKPKSLFGARHVQVLMLFLAMMIAYGMRVNMTSAVIAMTNTTNDNSFDWDIKIQDMVVVSFFWGYGFLQIPGGEIAGRFGGKVVIVLCIAINSFITLLLPTSAYYGDWKALRACRILLGLFQGFLYPSVHNLISKWVPLEERNRLGTIIYSGAHLGAAMQFMASNAIADYWGWPAIFYINGGLGALWTAIYLYVGSSSPRVSKRVSEEEKLYIQTSLGHVGEEKKLRTPVKATFISLPFNALIIAHSGYEWGFWILTTLIPNFMSHMLGVDITANGLMAALPYLSLYIMSFPFGFLTDYLVNKKLLSITAARKLSCSIGFYGPAIGFIVLAYAPADVKIVLLILAITAGLSAGHYTGFLLAHLDMAPNFAGTLMGVTDYLASATGVMVPTVASLLMQNETDQIEWRKMFFLTSFIYFACNTLYVLYGTCEKRKWNEPKSKSASKDNDTAETKSEKSV